MASVPSIAVDAANDLPGRNRTSIEVSGSHFPPGSAVNIKLQASTHTLRGTGIVRADGSFDWTITVRPQLACNANVAATVHGSDGMEVSGQSTVFCP